MDHNVWSCVIYLCRFNTSVTQTLVNIKPTGVVRHRNFELQIKTSSEMMMIDNLAGSSDTNTSNTAYTNCTPLQVRQQKSDIYFLNGAVVMPKSDF